MTHKINHIFITVLKQANITAVLKKGERYSKDKLIPIRILPNVPKVFEKCMFRQMSNYMDNFLSKHQSSFRKEYNTQY